MRFKMPQVSPKIKKQAFNLLFYMEYDGGQGGIRTLVNTTKQP
jgi:hypothetical protein